MATHEIKPEEMSWFEKPGTIRLLWIVLIMACAVVAGAGVWGAFRHLMHPHMAADAFPVFYGVFGFVAFSFIVLVGQHLRKILMRDEHYYDSPADLESQGTQGGPHG